MWLPAIGLVLVMACAGGQPTVQHGGVAPATSFRQLEGGACVVGDRAPVAVTDADCTCSPPPICGGATPNPPLRPQPGTWRCVPRDRTLLKPDGCPYVLSAGAACARVGKQCFVRSCGLTVTTATCRANGWELVSPILPDPS